MVFRRASGIFFSDGQFDLKDELHIDFVMAAANLYAAILGPRAEFWTQPFWGEQGAFPENLSLGGTEFPRENGRGLET